MGALIYFIATMSTTAGDDPLDDFEEMEPTIEEILNNPNYKWIFAGGKGGVGKTTSSCSIALELAKTRESVLIISTDPAHNLADAFNQKIESTPTKIEGVDNLYAMEVSAELNKEGMSSMLGEAADQFGLGSLMEDLGSALPGIDEAMSFAEVLKLVVSLEFSVVVFDTAPTGHTLRFLSFPDILEKGLAKMEAMKGQFGGLFKQFGSMMGMEGAEGLMDERMEQTRALTAKVNAQFKDPELTSFVYAFLNFFLCTKQSVCFNNWPSSRLIRTLSLSIKSFIPRDPATVISVRPERACNANTWTNWRCSILISTL